MQATSNSSLSWPTTPTENADEEDKDDFYYSLHRIVDDVLRHDILLLLGDLSVRVGCNNKNRESVMRKHEVGDLTNNGKRVIDLSKAMTSSSVTPSSRTGTSTTSPGHHLTDEHRARLIIYSSMANGEALFKMCR